MEFNNVKHKFGSWADHFKPFIESEDFDDIFKRLKYDKGRGKVICPPSEDTFRVFTETDYKDVKAIFVLQDPYPWKKRIRGEDMFVADGLAMSCSNTGECQPSLLQFYDGMEKELCGGLNLDLVHEPDLSYLAHQGVMLINASLTVELNKPGSHLDVWRKFTIFFLDEIINRYERSLPIAFFGKGAARYNRYVIPFHHWTKEVVHPAAAAHKGDKWNTEGLFGWVDTLLENEGSNKIKWFNEQNK